jgi:hypothetical protein
MEDGAFPGTMAQRGLGNHTSMDLILGKVRVRVRALVDAGIMTANRRA